MERSHPSDLPLIIFENKRTRGTLGGAWKRVSVPKFSSAHIHQTSPNARRAGSWGAIGNITETRKHAASGDRIAPEYQHLGYHSHSFDLHLVFSLYVAKLVQQQYQHHYYLLFYMHELTLL